MVNCISDINLCDIKGENDRCQKTNSYFGTCRLHMQPLWQQRQPFEACSR